MRRHHPRPVSVLAVSGSLQAQSYTSRALGLVADELRKMKAVHLTTLSVRSLHLGFPGRREGASVKRLKGLARAATGIVLATPEYNGSFSSFMKLIIENLGYPSILLGKPVVLLGAASGRIGAVKALEHLQSVCSHVGAIVLPGPVSVARVHEAFDKKGCCLDPEVEGHVRGLAHNLMNYIHNHITPKMALEELSRQRG